MEEQVTWNMLYVHSGIRELYSNPDGSPTPAGAALGWPGHTLEGHCLGLVGDVHVYDHRCDSEAILHGSISIDLHGNTYELVDRKMVLATEDWYPCYWNGVLVQLRRFNDQWSVSVWGADDTGMDAHELTEEHARRVFSSIKDFVTRAHLHRLGLRYQ